MTINKENSFKVYTVVYEVDFELCVKSINIIFFYELISLFIGFEFFFSHT